MLISVVTPVYGAPGCLEELVKRLRVSLSRITERFEIIMVNDASPDDSWSIIQRLAGQDPRVKGISLARNFGQHIALSAGLDRAQGDWVIVLDCDLQDRPEEVPALYSRAQQGFDVVFARRVSRRDPLLKKINSRLFYALFNRLSDTKHDPAAANFSICSARVIREFRKLRERNRSFPLAIRWLGFRSSAVDVEHGERFQGESSYSLSRQLQFASRSLTMHSNRPLELSIRLGAIMALASFAYASYLVIRYFLHGTPVEGWTSVMVSIWFLTGLLFANLGVLGLYVGRVFDETKGRPLYIVSDLLNFEPPL